MTSKKVNIATDARRYSVRKYPWDEWHFSDITGVLKPGEEVTYDDSKIVFDWLGHKYYYITSPVVGYLKASIIEGGEDG